ncbi:metallophosphoesterase [Rhodopseudomonas palustris]|uniref:metallophosphoesterase n=1 Tax=Rhodopseudomonas palustris TaxID=1076 RepID=UPI002ACE203A|nr:metallophosphoesterase [Rhodopseudomonas palustris]WQH00891.1 metallophosphoesterase [Rhodopseudomonas palustris]
MTLLDLPSTVCAIGDVHGRADLLASLIDFIEDQSARAPQGPRVYFLGDIVDRGPDSRRAMDIVCETLRRWPESRLLIGNHDFLFRDALTSQRLVHGWFDRGAISTLTSYLGNSDSYSFDDLALIKTRYPEHLRILQSASLIECIGRYAFVHAGIDPSDPIDRQDLTALLQIRAPFLDHVGPLSHIVVHGHSPLMPPYPVVTENRISIDTSAVHSGVLTMAAIDTENDRIQFYSTGHGGRVNEVDPVRLDRGFGTVVLQFAKSPSPNRAVHPEPGHLESCQRNLRDSFTMGSSAPNQSCDISRGFAGPCPNTPVNFQRAFNGPSKPLQKPS